MAADGASGPAEGESAARAFAIQVAAHVAVVVAIGLGIAGLLAGIKVALPLSILFLGGAVLGVTLVLRGHATLGNSVFVGGWLSTAFLATLLFGGASGPAFVSFFPATVCAAGLLGRAGALTATAVGVLAAALSAAGQAGLVPIGHVDVPGWLAASSVIANVALGGTTLALSDSFLASLTDQLLLKQEHLDPETGLLDHRGLLLALQNLDGGHGALVAIHIQGIRRARRGLGGPAASEAAHAVVIRLRGLVALEDTIARTGLSTFAVLHRDRGTGFGPRELAHRIQKILAEPVSVAGQELMLDAAVGVAEGGLADATSLLSDAEIAARSSGDATEPRRFQTEMRDGARQELELDARLRRALRGDQFEAWFQPIVDLRSGKIRSVEALMRWRAEDGSLVSPAEFVPRLEATGQIVTADRMILEQACAAFATWRKQGRVDSEFTLSVNLSPEQLVREDTPAMVRATLDRHGLPFERVRLELTERTLLADSGRVLENIRALRDLGLSIIIDDFGVGYSSLSYLGRVPVDGLKLDRAFVIALERPEGRRLASSILGMAESLGLSIVAEGIETELQAETLRALGYDVAQGFLWSRALPPNELMANLLQVQAGPNRPRAVADSNQPRVHVLAELRTRCARVMSRSDGLLHYAYDPGAVVTRQDAEDIVNALSSLSDVPRPTLVEMQRVRRLDAGCRTYYTETQQNRAVKTQVALVVSTPVSRTIAGFFVGLDSPEFRVAVFDSLREAEEWLRSFGKATRGSNASSA